MPVAAVARAVSRAPSLAARVLPAEVEAPRTIAYYDNATPWPYYFSAGNLTNVTELDGSTETYQYDALYRMSSESRTGTVPFAHAHGYDLAGNRQTYDTTGFSYDVANKLTQIGGVTQTNDNDGNQTALTYPNPASFVYDDLNRI